MYKYRYYFCMVVLVYHQERKSGGSVNEGGHSLSKTTIAPSYNNALMHILRASCNSFVFLKHWHKRGTVDNNVYAI